MNRSVFIPSILLSAVLLYLPSQGTTEKPAEPAVVPESQNQLIRLTDSGVEPTNIRMKKEDSIVFFLNQSESSLPTVEIDFHEHATHCSSANLKIDDNGRIRSQKPIGPNDFASTCFHETGTYDFTVYGLAKKPEGIKGKIFVE